MDIATIVKKTEPIFRKNRVSYAAIFGSRARGEERPDSDLDMLVRFGDRITLFGLLRMEQELSDILHLPVDVVAEGGMDPDIEKYVEPDLKTIYGEK